MKVFLWTSLLIEVIISSILVLILLFIVIRKKDKLFSRRAFESLRKLKASFIKVLVYLFVLTLGSFLLHEVVEVIDVLYPSHPFYLTFLADIRHVFIYLFLILLQSVGVYLVLRLIREQK